jgi:hypothetical protein
MGPLDTLRTVDYAPGEPTTKGTRQAEWSNYRQNGQITDGTPCLLWVYAAGGGGGDGGAAGGDAGGLRRHLPQRRGCRMK